MVGVALGTALASGGAGLVAQLWSWRVAFVVTGLAALALAVVLRRLVEPPRTRAHRTVLTPILAVARSRAALLVVGLAFVEGAVLGINSFDQWGVELGKELAGALQPMVEGREGVDGKDGSTAGLLAFLRAHGT